MLFRSGRRTEPRPAAAIDWRNPSLTDPTPIAQRSRPSTGAAAPPSAAPSNRPQRVSFTSVPGRTLSRSFGDQIDWARAGFQPAPLRAGFTEVIAPRRAKAPAAETQSRQPEVVQGPPAPSKLPADAPLSAPSSQVVAESGPRLGRTPAEARAAAPLKQARTARSTPTAVSAPRRRDRGQLLAPQGLRTPPSAPTLAGTGAVGLLGSFSKRIDWTRAGDVQTPFLARMADVGQTVAPRRRRPEQAQETTQQPGRARPPSQATPPTGTLARSARPGPTASPRATAPSPSATALRPGVAPQPSAPANLRQSARPILDWRRPKTASGNLGRSAGAVQSGPAQPLLRQAQQETIAPRRDLRDSFEEAMDWRAAPAEMQAAVEAAPPAPGNPWAPDAPLAAGAPRLSAPGTANLAAQAPVLARQAAYMGQTLAPKVARSAEESATSAPSARRRQTGTRQAGSRPPTARRIRGLSGTAPRGSLAARGRGVDFRSPPETSTARTTSIQAPSTGIPGRAPIQSDDHQVLPSKSRASSPQPASSPSAARANQRPSSGRLAPQQRRDTKTGRASTPQAAPLAQFTRFQGSPTFISRPSAPPPEPESETPVKAPPPSITQGAAPQAAQRRRAKSDARRVQGSASKGYHADSSVADEETWASGGFPDIEWTVEEGTRPASASARESTPYRPPPNLLQELAEEQMVDVLKKLTTSSPQARELLEEILEEVERLHAMDIMRKF